MAHSDDEDRWFTTSATNAFDEKEIQGSLINYRAWRAPTPPGRPVGRSAPVGVDAAGGGAQRGPGALVVALFLPRVRLRDSLDLPTAAD